MEGFGYEREEYLSEFFKLPNSIQNADTFRRVFERLDAKALALCLNEWPGKEPQKRCTIAIDGKTIRAVKMKNTKHLDRGGTQQMVMLKASLNPDAMLDVLF